MDPLPPQPGDAEPSPPPPPERPAGPEAPLPELQPAFPLPGPPRPAQGRSSQAPPAISAPGTPPAGPPRIAPRRRTASFWVAVILFFLLGGSLLLNLLFLGAAAVGTEHAGSGHRYREQVVEEGGKDKIVLIALQGVIQDGAEQALFGVSRNMVQEALQQLRQAARDPAVKAILLRVNSPGGGVTASDLLYHEVEKARKAGKKVVVHMGDLCASGGYYISVAADQLVASPTTITGSIGVIMGTVNATELLEKRLGVRFGAVKSGPHKDIGSYSREMTEEERRILQELIDQMYNRFVDLVIAGRQGRPNFPEAREAVRRLADGSIYTGEQAVKLGLVDKMGYLEDAILEAKRLAGLSHASVVSYRHEPSLLEILGGGMEGRVNINAGVQIDASSLESLLIPRLEYRWMPGP